MFDLTWLGKCDRKALQQTLRDYGYLVHRFPQYIALVIGHSDDIRVGQLLLGNLVDEIGGDAAPAHYALYRRLSESCGVELNWDLVSEEVMNVEAWFHNVYDGIDTQRALSVLGPGTEEVSQLFLEPLESAVVRCFPDADMRYFDVHRPEVEQTHIGDIRLAMQHLSGARPVAVQTDALRNTGEYAQEAQAKHRRFWRIQEERWLGASARNE